MAEFFEMFVQAENMLFTASLLVFVGLLAMLMLGFGLDGGDLDVDLDINETGPDGRRSDDAGSGYPLICFLLPFLGSFGILGVLSNWLLTDALNVTVTQKAIISSLLSGVVSYQLSGRLARMISSALPSVESYGLSNTHLAGCLAEVLGEKIGSSNTVRISVTDMRKNTFTLRGQMLPGHGEVLNGGLVKIVKHDADVDVCFCVPASESGTPSPPSDSA